MENSKEHLLVVPFLYRELLNETVWKRWRFNCDFATTAKWEGDLLLEEFVFVDPALRAKQIGLA